MRRRGVYGRQEIADDRYHRVYQECHSGQHEGYYDPASSPGTAGEAANRGDRRGQLLCRAAVGVAQARTAQTAEQEEAE